MAEVLTPRNKDGWDVLYGLSPQSSLLALRLGTGSFAELCPLAAALLLGSHCRSVHRGVFCRSSDGTFAADSGVICFRRCTF